MHDPITKEQSSKCIDDACDKLNAFLSSELKEETDLWKVEGLSVACIEGSVNLLLVCANSIDVPIDKKIEIFKKCCGSRIRLFESLAEQAEKKIWQAGQ